MGRDCRADVGGDDWRWRRHRPTAWSHTCSDCSGEGPVGPRHAAQAARPNDRGIVAFRTALLGGLVLEMTTKPDYAGVLIIIVTGILGIAWGALPWSASEHRRQQVI